MDNEKYFKDEVIDDEQDVAEDAEYVELLDENGEAHKLFIEAHFELEGKEYLILCDDESSDESFLFYVEEEGNDNVVIKEVEDDAEFERVSNYYYNS